MYKKEIKIEFDTCYEKANHLFARISLETLVRYAQTESDTLLYLLIKLKSIPVLFQLDSIQIF